MTKSEYYETRSKLRKVLAWHRRRINEVEIRLIQLGKHKEVPPNPLHQLQLYYNTGGHSA